VEGWSTSDQRSWRPDQLVHLRLAPHPERIRICVTPGRVKQERQSTFSQRPGHRMSSRSRRHRAGGLVARLPRHEAQATTGRMEENVKPRCRSTAPGDCVTGRRADAAGSPGKAVPGLRRALAGCRRSPGGSGRRRCRGPGSTLACPRCHEHPPRSRTARRARSRCNPRGPGRQRAPPARNARGRRTRRSRTRCRRGEHRFTRTGFPGYA
jgi:hypothetical protein